jgi:hypothetical protein
MNVVVKDLLEGLARFCGSRRNRRLLYLIFLSLLALGEFHYRGLVRRTFVFYSNTEGTPSVENRLLKRSGSRELDIRRYAEEVFLGPVQADSAPLFPKETRLRSLFLRDGAVYADLTEHAALPPPEGGDVFRSFLAFNGGIRRNFAWVQDVRIFVNGTEAYRGEFDEIFTPRRKIMNSGENPGERR